ncbi:hypothetical protein GCM10027450_06040 [Pseudidiomarina andamanensis]
MIVTNIIPHYNLSFYARLTSELKEKYNVIIIADQASDSDVFVKNEEEADINVVSLPFLKTGRFTYRKGLVGALRRLNPDKVVVYGNPRDMAVWLVLIYLKLTRKWCAAYGMFHRIGGMNRFSRVAYKAFGILSRKLFTYSRRGAITLDALGVDSNKIKVIGTAIDNNEEIQIFDKDTQAKFVADHQLEGKTVVLQVVRLSAYKKPGFIVDAAQEMILKNKRLLFVLIGGGELLEELKVKVARLELEQSIRILGPCYDKNQLSLWFSVAKISIVPTCIGLSAHHSLGFGVPVMTDDSIANQASEFDILQHGLNAVVYKEGSINDFILKLESFLDNEKMQESLSQGALNTIKYNSNLETKVRNFIDALS